MSQKNDILHKRQKFISWPLFYFLLTLFLAHCGGAGGLGGSLSGEGESGGSGGGSGSGINRLFEDGPIDMPVTIAKLEAPDPSKITVEIGGGTNLSPTLKNQSAETVTLTGLAGAMPDPTATPQVYMYSEANGTTLVDVNSNGSFAATTLTGTGPFLIAGYDGDQIGTPIFLQISGSRYIWFLTNGDEILGNVLAEDDSTTYVALAGETPSTSVNAADLLFADSSEDVTEIQSLDIAGTSEILGTVPCVADEMFARDSQVMVRCDNTFYTYTATSGEFTENCSVNSAETIQKIEVNQQLTDDEVYLGIITDVGAYACKVSTATLTTLDTLSAGQAYTEMRLFVYLNSGSLLNKLLMGMVAESSSGGLTTLENLLYDMSGTVIVQSFTSGSTGATYSTQEQVTNESLGVTVSVFNFTYTLGDSATYFPWHVPKTTTTGACAPAANDVSAWVVTSSQYSCPYLLDQSLSLKPGSSTATNATVCGSTQTRNILHVETHSSAKLICFCATDEASQGQIYALCPGLIGSSGPDGSEIIQLTSGVAHCDENKSWTCNDTIVISGKHEDFNEVLIIDPETDPLTVDCLDTDAGGSSSSGSSSSGGSSSGGSSSGGSSSSGSSGGSTNQCLGSDFI